MENRSQEQIYTEFYPKVLRYLSSRMNNQHDAEDLAQTVFLKVFSKSELFDERQSALSTWIFNITRNTLIDHQRAMSYRQHDEIPEILADDKEDILDSIIMDEDLGRLADALERLGDEERDLIILRYYKDYTLLQIAELMHRPYGQIKRLHAKVLQKLRFSLS